MIWQDIVFGVGTALFSIALIPTLRDTQKPALQTSLMTAVVLFIFAFTSATLGLWFACGSQILNGLIWSTLAWQRHTQKPAKDKL